MRIMPTLLPVFLIGIVTLFQFQSLANAACCTTESCAQQAADGSAQKTPAFACSLTALTPEQRKRHSELRKSLSESVKEVQELPDGYAFRLPGDSRTILSAAEFITYEKLCCPFFKFNLEIDSDGKPLWLKLSGREGVKQFLKTEFGLK
jgi:hypothetical protein